MKKMIFATALTMGAAVVLAGGSEAPKWAPIDNESRPWAYNWWMASAVDKEGLEAQCAAMEAGGLGGFHVIPIYGAKGFESKTREYLSPEWMEGFQMAVDSAAKHGLGVDLTTGSGWCFGGPWVSREHGCWKLEAVKDGKKPYVQWWPNGMRVKRAGPGGRGFMLDPYSKAAMTEFLSAFKEFEKPDTPKPVRFYHDSWEYYCAEWSPELFDEFAKRRGYRLEEHLQELAGIGDPEKAAQVKLDYRETLSDMVIENSFPLWVEWAHQHGFKVRNEAHGSCANWLDFYALADMPETEMYSGDADIIVSKFASSAAHVTGKKYVSSESCTWLGQHFGESLQDFKRRLDTLMLAGVNHIYYHGCCYSPVNVPWPGWIFYAGAEMNPRNPIWHDVRFLNDYIARCQAMFQNAEPDEDTLVYWPLRDWWYKKDLKMGFATPMSVHDRAWLYTMPVGAEAKKLWANGAAFDFVSDRMLQKGVPARYTRLVVPKCEHMPEATKKAVEAFVNKGAREEVFPKYGVQFTRMKRGNETLYFLVNQSAKKVVVPAKTSVEGAKWWMDPMTGEVKPAPEVLVLDQYASGFLVVKAGEIVTPSVAKTKSNTTMVNGPWQFSAVCGGPELPKPRVLVQLSSWSKTADGKDDHFSGTAKYTTSFKWNNPVEGEAIIDLGEVAESARVRINGCDAGFTFMEPKCVRFPARLLNRGSNELEIEVTSLGQNRLRWCGITGAKWNYFEDENVNDYRKLGTGLGEGAPNFDAETLPLLDCGLMGPVSISLLK